MKTLLVDILKFYLGYRFRDSIKAAIEHAYVEACYGATTDAAVQLAKKEILATMNRLNLCRWITLISFVATAVCANAYEPLVSWFAAIFAVASSFTLIELLKGKAVEKAFAAATVMADGGGGALKKVLPHILAGNWSLSEPLRQLRVAALDIINVMLSGYLALTVTMSTALLTGMFHNPKLLVPFIIAIQMAVVWSLRFSREPVILKWASAAAIVVSLMLTIIPSSWNQFKTTETYQDMTGVKQDAIGRIVMGKEKAGDRKILGSNAYDDLIEARNIARKKGATACEKQNAIAFDKRAKSAALDGKTVFVDIVDCTAVAKAQADAATKKSTETQKLVQAQTQRQAAAGRVMNTGKLSPSDRAILDGVAVHAQRYFSLNQKSGKTECEQGQMQELYAAISAYVKSGQSAPAQVRSCTAVAQNGGGSRSGSRLTEEQIAQKALEMTLADLGL